MTDTASRQDPAPAVAGGPEAIWGAYLDLLKPAAALAEQVGGPRSADVEYALYRQFAMNLAQGYFIYFQLDPKFPEFMPFEHSVFLAQPNPDSVYYLARIEAGGVYRVTGRRGDAPVAGFGLIGTLIGTGTPPGPGYGNFDIDDLQLADDGAFEVVFSETRPDGYAGDWRYTHPQAQFLLVRQFSVNWGEDVDVQVAIERLDPTGAKPPMTPAVTDAKLRELFGGYAERLSALCIGTVNRLAEKGFVNRAKLEDYNDYGNTDDWPQAYWECVFDIADDEALVIETDMPDTCHYWNVQVIDALWNQVEMVYRQSSLNNAQAKLDPDGKFRAVLCATDPGLHNWLDTNGCRYGMLIGRWYRASAHPVPVLTKVKIQELDRRFPATSPRVTPEQRQAMLRKRVVGNQMRRKW